MQCVVWGHTTQVNQGWAAKVAVHASFVSMLQGVSKWSWTQKRNEGLNSKTIEWYSGDSDSNTISAIRLHSDAGQTFHRWLLIVSFSFPACWVGNTWGQFHRSTEQSNSIWLKGLSERLSRLLQKLDASENSDHASSNKCLLDSFGHNLLKSQFCICEKDIKQQLSFGYGYDKFIKVYAALQDHSPLIQNSHYNTDDDDAEYLLTSCNEVH